MVGTIKAKELWESCVYFCRRLVLLNRSERVECPSVPFKEGDLLQRAPLLSSLQRPCGEAESDDGRRLQLFRDPQVLLQRLLPDPGVDTRGDPEVPCGELHVLDRPPCVKEVEALGGVCADHDGEVRASDPGA